MSDLQSVFLAYAIRAEEANPQKDGDYIGADGLLYCGKCKTAKQCRPFVKNPEIVVHCICKCIAEEERQREVEKANADNFQNRRICFRTQGGQNDEGQIEYRLKDDAYNTFERDDSPTSEPSKVCKAYADKFTPGTDWLLMSGTNGIGKSFYSACICNALIDKGFRCRFTRISEIESDLWGAENKSAVYSALARFDLVVLDDFGAERDTDYIHEIQFNVLDTLLQFGTTCIITTNLSAQELMNPQSKDMKRIFSRIYKKSIPLVCKGDDRRLKAMIENQKKLKGLIE